MKHDSQPPPPLRYRVAHALMWPLLNPTILNCRDAFRLTSERMDGPLRPLDSLRLRLHLVACRICRRLPAQFENLRQWVRFCHHEEIEVGADSEPLSREARERIEKHLHHLASR